jgi:hypothetical protein
MKSITCILSLCLILAACKSNKQDSKPDVPVKADSVPKLPKPDRNKPDSTIAIKENYEELSGAEISKEDPTRMDMSYFPSNYALEKGRRNPIQMKIRITYSRPHRWGRTLDQLFGDSTIPNVPIAYGKIWRLGANESTEIEFMEDVEVGGKKLRKGRYTVYAIPFRDHWTILFNTELYTWGHFNYNPSKTVVTADAPVERRNDPVETFNIYFQKTATGANMIMSWDILRVSLPIVLK